MGGMPLAAAAAVAAQGKVAVAVWLKESSGGRRLCVPRACPHVARPLPQGEGELA